MGVAISVMIVDCVGGIRIGGVIFLQSMQNVRDDLGSVGGIGEALMAMVSNMVKEDGH